MSSEILARKCAEIMIDALKKADAQISAVGEVFPEIAGQVRKDLPVNKWLELCQKWLPVPVPASAPPAVAAAAPDSAAASVKPPAAAAAAAAVAAPVAMDDDKKEKKTLKRKEHPTKEPKSRGIDLGASADAPPSSDDDKTSSSSRRGRRSTLTEEERKARRAVACKAYRARLAAQKAAESAAKAAAIKATVESLKAAKAKANAAAASTDAKAPNKPAAAAAAASADSKAPKKPAAAAAAAAAAAPPKPKAEKKSAAVEAVAAAAAAASADDDVDIDDAATEYDDESEDIEGEYDGEGDDCGIDTKSAAWQIYEKHMKYLRPQKCIECKQESVVPCTSCMEVMLCHKTECRLAHQAEPTCLKKQTIGATADLMLCLLDEEKRKVYHTPIYPDLPGPLCCSVCKQKFKFDENTGKYKVFRCEVCLQSCVCDGDMCLVRHMDTPTCRALSLNENILDVKKRREKLDPHKNPFPTMTEYSTSVARQQKDAMLKKFFAK